MDGYLAERFINVKKHLDKGFDIFGAISGENRVATGKSFCASQLGYFIAWCIAGGKMNLDRDPITGKFINARITKKPDKPLNFSLDNIVFDPEKLMELARTLPRNSVIIYDETGAGGVSSKNTMSSLNKKFEFFQETCRFYGHVFLLVLPNFFKLHNDIAVSRTDFLLDCPLRGTKRGQWRLWGRRSKEKLFEFSRFKIGASAKYATTPPDKFGRFTNLFTLNLKEYTKKKHKALAKVRKTQIGLKAGFQRDAAIFLYKKASKKTSQEVSEDISRLIYEPITFRSVEHCLTNLRSRGTLKMDEKDRFYLDFKKSEEDDNDL